MKSNIGENIRQLREKREMSVERVARMLEVKPATVIGWESGRELPEPAELGLLAKLFDVTVEELNGTSEANTIRQTETTPGIDETTAGSASGAGRGFGDIGEGAFDSGDRNPTFAGETGGRSDIWKSPLAAYLADNEKVLWAGQPTPEHVGGRMSGAERIFNIIVFGFIIFWLVYTIRFNSFVAVFGLFFFWMWLYTVFGKKIVLYINKPNIYYAVTNMRVMLCITGRVNRFRDISYRRLTEVRLILSRRKTGCGTIVFVTPAHAPEYPYGRRYDRVAYTNSLLNSFIDIADAKHVYDLINAAKSEYEENEM
ncbi:MAG: helix-turn-helix transcriptional regulator [Clostridiales bacterium]|nr:helix-turn-helix transcriptional regulator [Clostridiales bacterium]